MSRPTKILADTRVGDGPPPALLFLVRHFDQELRAGSSSTSNQ
ncbi:MAG TPA: hypothetical protein VLV78_06310 [Thermoanaerobaculia bacterium]|nr:hypothetical protein [Thermoanaerobaculia bacterium]